MDYARWQTPDQGHAQMVIETKDSLETKGFVQIIEGITRLWPGTTDSLIDHLWTNSPPKDIVMDE